MPVRAYFKGFPTALHGEKISVGDGHGLSYVIYPDWKLMHPSDEVVDRAVEWTLLETFSSKDGHKFPVGIIRDVYRDKDGYGGFYELQISQKVYDGSEIKYEVRCRSGKWLIIKYVMNDLIYGKYPTVSVPLALGILIKALKRVATYSAT
jgi:hypothetical protein